jgi:hypothetical protein
MKNKEHELITVILSQRERDLIADHTLADPDYSNRFRTTEKNGTTLSAHFTTDELDDLLGYVAAEANHSKSKKIERELDKLYSKLEELEP